MKLGYNFLGRLKKNYESTSFVRFFVIFLCFCILYGIIHLTYGGFFLTGDDRESERVLSGYYTGQPSSYSMYVSTPIGVFLKFFYTHFPTVRWYTYFLIFSTVLCVSIITYIFLEHLSLNKCMRQIIGMILIGFASLTLFIYPIFYVSFTLTAALYATAAILLLLHIHDQNKNLFFYFRIATSILLLLMSCLVRAQSYKAVLPFFLFTFVYVLYIDRKKIKRSVAWGLLISVVVSVTAITFISKWDAYYKKQIVESNSFVEFDKYRGDYSDYLQLDYISHKELFDSIGWDESFYLMSKEQSMYIDKRFTTENIKAIIETQNKEKMDSSISDSLMRFFSNYQKKDSREYTELLHIKRLLPIGTIIISVLGIIFLSHEWRKKKKGSLQTLFLIGNHSIAVMEFVYLCIRGRFILRAVLCASIPILCIDFFLLIEKLPVILERASNSFLKISHPYKLELQCKSSMKSFSNHIIIRFDSFILFWMFLTFFFSMISISKVTFRVDQIDYLKDCMTKALVSEEYCNQHSENFYVTNYVTIMDHTLHLRSGTIRGRRKNLLYFGGPQVFCKSYFDAIKAYGYNEFFMDKLLDDNVYFICDTNNLQDSVMLSYMRNAYGDDIQCYLVDLICDGVFVYKFFRPEGRCMLFSQNVLNNNVCLISENDNLNNSEFAAYVRGEYGNDVNCKLLAILSENKYLYIIVKENEESESISLDILDFLHEKDIFYINE